jgi:hypothetical protein
MEKILILIPFALIPWVYCALKNKPINYYYYAIFVYWFPINLPFDLTVSEYFIYYAVLSLVLFKRRSTEITHPLPNYVLLFFLLFVLGGITSTFNSISDEYLLTGFRRTVIFPIAIIYLTSKLIHDHDEVEKVLKIFIISTMLFFIFLYLFPKSNSWMNYRGFQSLRLGGEYLIFNKYQFAFYESTLGALFGFLLPTIYSEYISSSRNKVIYLIIFIIFLIALISTMGRAGWIAGFIGMALVYVSSTLLNVKKLVYVVMIALISFIFFKFVFLRIFPYTGFAIDRLLTLQNYQSIGTYQARLYQWIMAFEVFREHNYGIGMWNFSIISNAYGYNYSGNSTWLMLLLDVGIIGIIGFLFLYVNIIVRGIMQYRRFLKDKTFRYVGIIASIIVLPIAGAGETFFQSNYYASFSIWLVIALAINMLMISPKIR